MSTPQKEAELNKVCDNMIQASNNTTNAALLVRDTAANLKSIVEEQTHIAESASLNAKEIEMKLQESINKVEKTSTDLSKMMDTIVEKISICREESDEE